MYRIYSSWFERYADGTVLDDYLNWMKAGILYYDRILLSQVMLMKLWQQDLECGIDQILEWSVKLSVIYEQNWYWFIHIDRCLLEYHLVGNLSSKAQK